MNNRHNAQDSEVNPMSQGRLKVYSAAQEVHRQNIQRNIEHRLEVARAKGDERLIRQLEAELRQFA